MGGQFSINLRSAFFNPNKQEKGDLNTTLLNNRSARKSYNSTDSKRYRSWMDGEKTFTKTKRSSRSYFHKDRENKDVVIE